MRHRKHLILISLLSVLFLAGWAVSALGAKPTTWDVDAARKKADYYFMRSLGAFALDSNDAGMRLMKRATELNPSDGQLRAQLAMAQLSYGPSDDDSTIAVLYGPLLDEFRANPTDYTGANLTAKVAEHLNRFDDLVEIYTTLDSLFPAKTAPAASLATAYINRYIASNDTTDFQHAIDILNRLERGTGKDIGLTSQKVRAYALRNDNDAIVRELTELQEALPAEPSAFLMSAGIYAVIHLDSLVLPNLKQACAIDSTFGQGLMALADYYRTAGDSVAYDSTVFRVLRSPDVEFNSKYQILRNYIGTMFSDSTQWPRIDNLFTILQQVNPGEPAMHRLYGSYEVSRQRWNAAADQFSFALALSPQDEELRSLAVQSLLAAAKAGNKALNDSAIAVAKEGMTVSPDNLYFPIVAAATLNEEGKSAEAISLLRSVDISEVRNKQAVSNFLTSLGDIYYKDNQADSAFAVYDRAIELYPDNYMAANNYAYFLSVKGQNLDKALDLSRSAVLSEPDNPTYLDTYAWVYFKQKNYPEAKIQIDRALDCYKISVDSVAPDTVAIDLPSEPVSGTGEVVTVSDGDEVVTETDEGDVVEEEAIETPGAEIYEHAGDIYFMNGEPAKALEFWQKALELDPENALLAKKVKNKAYYYE